MQLVTNVVSGGSKFRECRDEQQFKTAYIKHVLKWDNDMQRIFCIETEETVKGFPDVIEVITHRNGVNHVYMYEFKISDREGKIKFQPTQPAFYRKNPNMDVHVVALNRKTMNVHRFSALSIFDSGSPYCMNSKAVVNLNVAEEKDRNADTGN